VYDRAYYTKPWRKKLSTLVEKIMRWTVAEFGPFRSSFDLGAGCGDWSWPLVEAGTEAWAVDWSGDAISLMPQELRNLKHDLRKPLDLERAFDLVICVEVAEHLPESAADTLCQTIVRHCGKLLIFTAAPPSQGGTGHINCQPKGYWKSKLVGLAYLPGETKRMKAGWGKVLGGRFRYLSQNLMVFGL